MFSESKLSKHSACWSYYSTAWIDCASTSGSSPFWWSLYALCRCANGLCTGEVPGRCIIHCFNSCPSTIGTYPWRPESWSAGGLPGWYSACGCCCVADGHPAFISHGTFRDEPTFLMAHLHVLFIRLDSQQRQGASLVLPQRMTCTIVGTFEKRSWQAPFQCSLRLGHELGHFCPPIGHQYDYSACVRLMFIWCAGGHSACTNGFLCSSFGLRYEEVQCRL